MGGRVCLGVDLSDLLRRDLKLGVVGLGVQVEDAVL